MELRIECLNKRYRTVEAVRDFTLTLRPGILGLLGPNGAGKSTLMRMLATVTKPTSGAMFFNGTNVARSPDDLRRSLGYLPQDFGVYPHLNAIEFLEYIGALKGMHRKAIRPRVDELLDTLNLSHARSRTLGGFSGGMRQRVGIAQALLNDPKLLIVDEPSTGLDPEERVRLRNMLSALGGDRIVILSTHICSDVETIASRIAIVGRGRLLACDAPSALTNGCGSLEAAYLRIVSADKAAA